MREVFIRPLAKQDIKDIWVYTLEHWGAQQADRYTLEIGRHIKSLLEFPLKGVAIDDIRQGYRKLVAGKHLVFYRVNEDTIDVVRVLKQEMDIPQHLGKD